MRINQSVMCQYLVLLILYETIRRLLGRATVA